MSQNPTQIREHVIASLRRGLIGPSGAGDAAWLGATVDEDRIITPGRQIDESFPIGPWFAPDGEEILTSSPGLVYGVGVLFPKMDAAVLAAARARETEELRSIDAALSDAHAADAEVGIEELAVGSKDSDADVLPEESLGKPRSMALSFRTAESGPVSVTLKGGIYMPISVAGQSRTWWQRQSVEHQLHWNSGDGETSDVTLGALTLRMGIDSRPQADGTLIRTVWVRNDTEASTYDEISKRALFQCEIAIETDHVVQYDRLANEQIESLDLLYADKARLVVGHGVDAEAIARGNSWILRSESMPICKVQGVTALIEDGGMPYTIGMTDLAQFTLEAQSEIDRLIANYTTWIESRTAEVSQLEVKYHKIAYQHLDECKKFLTRIKHGWAMLQVDTAIRKPFCDMSKSMNNQRVGYSVPLREVTGFSDGFFSVEGSQPRTNSHSQSFWRPFQIAFILSELEAVVNPEAAERQEVAVIWMPTGGGKTEAYLGLAAFTILWTRSQDQREAAPHKDRSYTKVLMRYTLRLLTAQQLARAASLICALEIQRRQEPGVYGANEIRIGAWLGSSSSPNSWDGAVTKLSKLIAGDRNVPSFMLQKCPWCGTQMGGVFKSRIAGYRKVKTPSAQPKDRVQTFCPDANCSFAFRQEGNVPRGLPVFEVDDDIYNSPPDFLVGTVDKFARLAWKPESQSIFGLKSGQRRNPPPTLMIQDELHLISGPLGSIDGAYEPALEYLCEFDGGTAPLIVAATATTRNFEEQLFNLYARHGHLIPPPGLTVDDSFFARKDPDDPGKIYVGVCAAGYSSALSSQARVLAQLAYTGGLLRRLGFDCDPWWSNVVFFSSRRALGQLNSFIDTSMKQLLHQIRMITGVSTGEEREGKRNARRFIGRIRELTATSSEDVSVVLADLSHSIESGKAIDLCFATSMIEVGLDVPRLGLMTVIGQPKSASQYIQVTGRVGRDKRGPGIVISVLSPTNLRDRSHYESFNSWHDRLYASVEPSSVTPFTNRALERSAPSAMALLLRFLGHKDHVTPAVTRAWDQCAAVLQRRAQKISKDSLTNLTARLTELKRIATAPEVQSGFAWDHTDGKSTFFMYDSGALIPHERAAGSYWRVLNSMRSVDSDAAVQMMWGVRSIENSLTSASEDEDFEI